MKKLINLSTFVSISSSQFSYDIINNGTIRQKASSLSASSPHIFVIIIIYRKIDMILIIWFEIGKIETKR